MTPQSCGNVVMILELKMLKTGLFLVKLSPQRGVAGTLVVNTRVNLIIKPLITRDGR